MRAFTAGSGVLETTGSGRGVSGHQGGATSGFGGTGEPLKAIVQGVKMRQQAFKLLI